MSWSAVAAASNPCYPQLSSVCVVFLLRPGSRALGRVKDDRGYGAPYTFNLQQFIFQEVSEFLYARC